MFYMEICINCSILASIFLGARLPSSSLQRTKEISILSQPPFQILDPPLIHCTLGHMHQKIYDTNSTYAYVAIHWMLCAIQSSGVARINLYHAYSILKFYK